MKAKFIEEALSFDRKSDSKEHMGIGKIIKYKKLYSDLLKEMPAFFSSKVLDLEVTNKIPIDRVVYVIPEIYKRFIKFFESNSDFEFVDVQGFKPTYILIKEK